MKSILISFSLLLGGFTTTQILAQSLVIRQSVAANNRSSQQTPTTLLAYNQIQAHASAFYTAGQSITLQPGFEARAGSFFAATIGPVFPLINEPQTGLSVRALGNPVTGAQAHIEIRGAQGQTVSLRLVDLQGSSIHEQRIEQAGEIEAVSVPLGQSRGLLLLKVSTDNQQQQVKLLRP